MREYENDLISKAPVFRNHEDILDTDWPFREYLDNVEIMVYGFCIRIYAIC